MNDYDLIDNILPQYHFLKEKCMKNMAVRGGCRIVGNLTTLRFR